MKRPWVHMSSPSRSPLPLPSPPAPLTFKNFHSKKVLIHSESSSFSAGSLLGVAVLWLWFFSHSVTSSSLRPHGLQHARLLFPSLSPRVCSNSCPSSRWCHPTISSSVAPFSSCLQSFPASGSSPMSWLSSHHVAKTLELQHQSFKSMFRVDFL